MFWQDEGYLLHKRNFDENSILIEAFTISHGKYSGIVYGGSSRKQKRFFQVGNKILLNWRSKGENKIGYFTIELIKPVSPLFFDDKKKSICIVSASTILKILLPERQTNEKIYHSFEKLIYQLNHDNWIKNYILWELSLINQLGYEINFFDNENLESNNINQINLNNKSIKVPRLIQKNNTSFTDIDVKEALQFNKHLIMENFIIPNNLKFPLSRNILEKYF